MKSNCTETKSSRSELVEESWVGCIVRREGHTVEYIGEELKYNPSEHCRWVREMLREECRQPIQCERRTYAV